MSYLALEEDLGDRMAGLVTERAEEDEVPLLVASTCGLGLLVVLVEELARERVLADPAGRYAVLGLSSWTPRHCLLRRFP